MTIGKIISIIFKKRYSVLWIFLQHHIITIMKLMELIVCLLANTLAFYVVLWINQLFRIPVRLPRLLLLSEPLEPVDLPAACTVLEPCYFRVCWIDTDQKTHWPNAAFITPAVVPSWRCLRTSWLMIACCGATLQTLCY